MTVAATLILYPLFAMVLLVAIVVTLLWSLRKNAIRSRQVSIGYYRDFSGDEPNYNKVVARHYSNLFEMPVLFYLVVIAAYLTQHVTVWMVGLAWVYVLCRYVHSYVHLTQNLAFLLSAIVLLAMWLGLLLLMLKS